MCNNWSLCTTGRRLPLMRSYSNQSVGNTQDIYELKRNKVKYTLFLISLFIFPFFHLVFKILLMSSYQIDFLSISERLPLFFNAFRIFMCDIVDASL